MPTRPSRSSPVKLAKLVKQAKPVKPVKQVKPVKPVKQAKPAKPAKQARPVEPVSGRPKNLISLQTSLSSAHRATLVVFAMLAQTVRCMFIPRSAEDRGDERIEIHCDPLRGLLNRKPRITLPFIQENLALCYRVIQVIQWAVPRVASDLEAAGVPGVRRKNRFVSLILVRPGAHPQPVHKDMATTGARGYYTAILPVTTHAGQGDTEFGYNEPFFTEDGPKAHDGAVPHRGGANRSQETRVALCIVFCDGMDLNRVGVRKAASFPIR